MAQYRLKSKSTIIFTAFDTYSLFTYKYTLYLCWPNLVIPTGALNLVLIFLSNMVTLNLHCFYVNDQSNLG